MPRPVNNENWAKLLRDKELEIGELQGQLKMADTRIEQLNRIAEEQREALVEAHNHQYKLDGEIKDLVAMIPKKKAPARKRPPPKKKDERGGQENASAST